MFLTLDPSHPIDWHQFNTWAEYNEEYVRRFARWRGGRRIQRLIAPLQLGLSDVWLGDTIKCPVDNSLRSLETPEAIEQAADHCNEYLKQEVAAVDPKVIVTMGDETTHRLLQTVFDISPDPLKTGTRDCGRVFETSPPVVVSLHWSHGWLDWAPNGRPNLKIVQDALIEIYPE